MIPAEKNPAAFIRSNKLESQAVVHIFQVVIQISLSQVKSWTGFYFTWNLKQSFQLTWTVLETQFTLVKSFQVLFSSDLHSSNLTSVNET
jgi:hypothetical protein